MTVAALAGRRVDAPEARIARFPLANITLVRQRIQKALERFEVQALVCSAACGADLLALQAAGDLRIRRRVVLPGAPARFRHTSVIDRPGEWGPLFDRIVADLQAQGELLTIARVGDDLEGYARANITILDEALKIGKHLGVDVIALVVWDGESRGQHGMTETFAADATRRGLHVHEISTLGTSPDA